MTDEIDVPTITINHSTDADKNKQIDITTDKVSAINLNLIFCRDYVSYDANRMKFELTVKCLKCDILKSLFRFNIKIIF